MLRRPCAEGVLLPPFVDVRGLAAPAVPDQGCCCQRRVQCGVFVLRRRFEVETLDVVRVALGRRFWVG